jgi:hypothetical protein
MKLCGDIMDGILNPVFKTLSYKSILSLTFLIWPIAINAYLKSFERSTNSSCVAITLYQLIFLPTSSFKPTKP